MAERQEDFYIGYKPEAPAALGRWLRRVVLGLLLLAAALAIVLPAAQRGFPDSNFEFGNVQRFEGRLAAFPYPILHVGEEGGERPHYLVEFGKHGARAELDDLDGRTVGARGQLVYRGQERMIELTADPVDDLGPARSASGARRELGSHRLVGEILDSKCYLGVMKPGRGKPHRSCAARCLSGGVPPMLLVVDGRGDRRHLLIAGRDGEPIGRELVELVAQPVAVTGAVSVRDGVWYLEADAGDFELFAPGEGGGS